VEALNPREGGAVPAPRKYPNELRERAQRLVVEPREQEPELSLNAAVKRIGPRVGVQPDTLRGWCKRADIDAGRAPGTTTADADRLKALEQEVRELKRATRSCSRRRVSSRRELDPQLPW
jgi:transposase-like protein